MSLVIDARWQKYEVMDKEPVLDQAGEQQVDSTGTPLFKDIPTGVFVEVKAMDFQTTQRVMTLFKEFKQGVPAHEQIQAANPMMHPELVPIMKDTLPKYVRNVTGLQLQTDEGVRDAVIEDFIQHGQLLLYAVQILLRLFAISNVGGEERGVVKNSLATSSGGTP